MEQERTAQGAAPATETTATDQGAQAAPDTQPAAETTILGTEAAATTEGKYTPPPWQMQAKGEKKYDDFYGKFKAIDELMDAAKAYSTENEELKRKIGEVTGSIPEKLEDYSDAKDLPAEIPDDFKEKMKKSAAENKFSQEQYQAFQKFLVENEAEEVETLKKQGQETLNAMKEKWGDNYNAKIQSIMRTKAGIEALGVKNFGEMFKDPKIGNNMIMIEAMDALSTFFSDDRLLDGSDRGNEVESSGRLKYPGM